MFFFSACLNVLCGYKAGRVKEIKDWWEKRAWEKEWGIQRKWKYGKRKSWERERKWEKVWERRESDNVSVHDLVCIIM